MSTSVTGHLAGEGAAEFLASATPVEGDDVDDDIDALRRAVYAPLGREGLAPRDVLKKIVAKCNAHAVDLDVSIHFNSGAGNPSSMGQPCRMSS